MPKKNKIRFTTYDSYIHYTTPWACGPLGPLAISPNPISAAGSIRSKPCFCIELLILTNGGFETRVGSLNNTRRTRSRILLSFRRNQWG